ncbi:MULTISPECIES: hypothetical protein [unclassified Empedobacter]|uniref:hypothetical protein n=1 Tax=unclassified Empedobacter TaxID=2643773 RepID=UPI00244CD3D3|nr:MULTISPECIES: hypothetical protein [unclassified Empedobacter]MDH2208592.1 hypothetical protein [Empedobacter sp. GD03644]
MEYYNKEIFFLFIGAIFSILLPVVLIIGKQGHKRQEKRAELEKNNTVGNIDQWLNDSYEYKQSNFFQLMTEWNLQPLFIVSITNLIENSNFLNVSVTFILILLIILHELWVSKRYSSNGYYQLLSVIIWISTYLILVNKIA